MRIVKTFIIGTAKAVVALPLFFAVVIPLAAFGMVMALGGDRRFMALPYRIVDWLEDVMMSIPSKEQRRPT